MCRDGETKAQVCTPAPYRGHVILGGGGRGEQIKEAEEEQAKEARCHPFSLLLWGEWASLFICFLEGVGGWWRGAHRLPDVALCSTSGNAEKT